MSVVRKVQAPKSNRGYNKKNKQYRDNGAPRQVRTLKSQVNKFTTPGMLTRILMEEGASYDC